MDQQLKVYLDKQEVRELLTGYFKSIDEKVFEKHIAEAAFTSDARIVKPNGSETVGHDSLLESNKKSFARFKATHHVSTDYLIDITGNSATVRANLTGMHLWADNENDPTLNNKHFYAGIVLTAKAVRTDLGWRISELAYRNVWRTGDGLAEMAKMVRPNS